MYDYGYIEVSFFKKNIPFFKKLVEKACKKSDFYAPKGDVTHKLHLTLFYGIIEDNLDKKQMVKHIKEVNLNSIKLGKMILMKVSKDFCVLSLEVIDNNGKLLEIHDSFKDFPFEKTIQYPKFTPHIALVYVKPSFKLIGKLGVDIPRELKIKSIKYRGI